MNPISRNSHCRVTKCGHAYEQHVHGKCVECIDEIADHKFFPNILVIGYYHPDMAVEAYERAQKVKRNG